MRQRRLEKKSLVEEDPKAYLTRFSLNSCSESGRGITMLQEMQGRVDTLYDRNETIESRIGTIVQVLPAENFGALDISPSASMSLSEESWQLARFWIKSCEDHHAECRRLLQRDKVQQITTDDGSAYLNLIVNSCLVDILVEDMG